MKRILLFLLLCGLCRADVTFYIGGSAAANTNGGLATSTVAAATVCGLNGVAPYNTTDATAVDLTGVITKAGAFASGLTGVYVNIVSGTNCVAGRYAITASDTNTITVSSAAFTGDSVAGDIVCHVGGALDDGADFAAAWAIAESALGDATSQNVTIKINSNCTTTAQIATNGAYQPGLDYTKRIVGCDSAWAELAVTTAYASLPSISTASAIDLFLLSVSDRIQVQCLQFLATGTGTGYVVDTGTTSEGCALIHCYIKATGTGQEGVRFAEGMVNNCYIETTGTDATHTLDLYGGTIVSSYIKGVGNSGTEATLEMESAVLPGIVFNNIIIGSQEAVRVDGPVATYSVVIAGNTIDASVHGIYIEDAAAAGTTPVLVLNNLITNCTNGVNGVAADNEGSNAFVHGNFFYSNDTADTVNIGAGCLLGNTVLAADPYTNQGTGDYSLNATANGGALVKNAYLWKTFLGVSLVNYLDGGAMRHVDPAGGVAAFRGYGGL